MEQVLVRANALQQTEWLKKPVAPTVEIHWVNDFNNAAPGAVLVDLLYETAPLAYPANHFILVNAVITGTDLPTNFIRINAWPGFLERKIVELSGQDETVAQKIMSLLNWQYQWVLNEPGFISARTIAMIINEAYFAWGNAVASKKDIDIAMKLGTNYPYGPFEWASKIGLFAIYQLLTVLSASNERYQPAAALVQEATNTNS